MRRFGAVLYRQRDRGLALIEDNLPESENRRIK
jgi:hypothetical protein